MQCKINNLCQMDKMLVGLTAPRIQSSLRCLTAKPLCRPRCCRETQTICRAVLETTTVGKATNIRQHEATVKREEKEMLLGQRGCVIWFTGKPCYRPKHPFVVGLPSPVSQSYLARTFAILP